MIRWTIQVDQGAEHIRTKMNSVEFSQKTENLLSTCQVTVNVVVMFDAIFFSLLCLAVVRRP